MLKIYNKYKKLDLFGLEIEEVLGIANAKLLRQRRKRLENSVNNSIN
ncbi:MAG: hypothetical protein MK111_02830 [Crocosphaera sp.]|nr:hypothetical protein [Crocosphaera sp.]MCH2243570.1 hypothetical protein [Crocosphaera sp.]